MRAALIGVSPIVFFVCFGRSMPPVKLFLFFSFLSGSPTISRSSITWHFHLHSFTLKFSKKSVLPSDDILELSALPLLCIFVFSSCRSGPLSTLARKAREQLDCYCWEKREKLTRREKSMGGALNYVFGLMRLGGLMWNLEGYSEHWMLTLINSTALI